MEKLAKRFKTRDPFQILEGLNVVVGETDRYEKLKGYCFMSCQTIYVMISSFLSEEEKRIVAAHELGHVVLHRAQLKLAPMKDEYLYNMKDNTEYQANLFAADLLLEDDEIDKILAVKDPCGSPSIRSTFLPSFASPTPRFITVVLFETPPFWFETDITLHINFPP